MIFFLPPPPTPSAASRQTNFPASWVVEEVEVCVEQCHKGKMLWGVNRETHVVYLTDMAARSWCRRYLFIKAVCVYECVRARVGVALGGSGLVGSIPSGGTFRGGPFCDGGQQWSWIWELCSSLTMQDAGHNGMIREDGVVMLGQCGRLQNPCNSHVAQRSWRFHCKVGTHQCLNS